MKNEKPLIRITPKIEYLRTLKKDEYKQVMSYFRFVTRKIWDATK